MSNTNFFHRKRSFSLIEVYKRYYLHPTRERMIPLLLGGVMTLGLLLLIEIFCVSVWFLSRVSFGFFGLSTADQPLILNYWEDLSIAAVVFCYLIVASPIYAGIIDSVMFHICEKLVYEYENCLIVQEPSIIVQTITEKTEEGEEVSC